VKSSPVALAFPFFVLAMIPFRLLLGFIFTKVELDAVRFLDFKKIEHYALKIQSLGTLPCILIITRLLCGQGQDKKVGR
jgi:hypothetical protein